MKNFTLARLRMLFSCVLILSFSFAHAQQHTITGFSPTNAAIGERVTILGTNFSSITGVSFGATPAASFIVVSATRITAVLAAGTSGSIAVSKTGFTTVTRSGFTFSPIPTVSSIITDFGGFWNTNTTANNATFPNDAHNLLAFTYGGVNYSTGVDNAALSANGIAYTASNFKALPAIMNGNTSGGSLYIVAASKIDGNTGAALFTHPNIKDLTMQSVLSDGLSGLNLGTGYTNLPIGATSNFTINGIQISKAGDDEPDLVITQIADPSTSAFDTYRFLDASNNVVGTALNVDLSKISALGTYYLDLYNVATGVPFAVAKPISSSFTNTTRQIRFIAFKLSDFGITIANYSLVKKLQVLPSGVTDMAFVAYNTAAINVPPSIAKDSSATSSAICNPGGGAAKLVVNATAASGGILSYDWEISTNGGTSWLPVTNGGVYSTATTNALNISAATIGNMFRANVTESGSGFSATSETFTITAIVNTALAGTLNPNGFTNCLNAITGTTSLSVLPTGGSGSFSYQWSVSPTLAGTYTDIPGAFYNNLSPALNVAGTLYYKVMISSGCLSSLSNAAVVVIAGEQITSVTNGSSCSPGVVTLSATASGGTINWYAAVTGGSPLGSGSSYDTPSLGASATFYVGTTSGTCQSIREPVSATIVNTISLSSNNFNISFASNVCAGAGSDITITTSGLPDGVYNMQYNITGANTVTGANSPMTVSGGRGSFTTALLFTAGSNTLTITDVQVGACSIVPSSGNSISFNVNAGSPLVSNFAVLVSAGCSNQASLATVSSNTLAGGTYLVTYDVTGSNTLTSQISQMIFAAGAPGTGTFLLAELGNQGSNTITITGIALLSAPDCGSALSAGSPAFLSSIAASADAGTPKEMCASDIAVNITGGASAENYVSLQWSTSNGTGTFANNNTADALSATTYTPDAADIARGSAFITLTATPAGGCTPVVKTIVLTINAATVAGTVSASQTIPTGSQPADLTLSGYTGTIVKWQQSSDAAFTTPTDIANTTAVLTGASIGALSTTTYFRAVVKSGNCAAGNSAFVIINMAPLPVKFLYFSQKCEGNNVLLQWATAFELNNNHFIIQKSSDATNWRAIAQMTGAGNSNSARTYAYTDTAAAGGIYFYRIAQTDVDGSSSYSEVVNSNCVSTGSKKEFTIYPNPGKDLFVLNNLPAKGSFYITDNKGRELLSVASYPGRSYQLNLAQLPSGVYYVTVFENGKRVTKKLLIK